MWVRGYGMYVGTASYTRMIINMIAVLLLLLLNICLLFQICSDQHAGTVYTLSVTCAVV
jgi:hypothetical protein